MRWWKLSSYLLLRIQPGLMGFKETRSFLMVFLHASADEVKHYFIIGMIADDFEAVDPEMQYLARAGRTRC